MLRLQAQPESFIGKTWHCARAQCYFLGLLGSTRLQQGWVRLGRPAPHRERGPSAAARSHQAQLPQHLRCAQVVRHRHFAVLLLDLVQLLLHRAPVRDRHHHHAHKAGQALLLHCVQPCNGGHRAAQLRKAGAHACTGREAGSS